MLILLQSALYGSGTNDDIYGSYRGHLGRSILVAFLAMFLAISRVTRYSPCAYQ